VVGQLVAEANRQAVPLADLPLAAFQQADPSLDDSVRNVLGVRNAVRAFVSFGSTGPKEVAGQVAYWKAKLGSPADTQP
jgi:argininosuccinate lyase